jgi:arylsulfatase A-like enzyme
VISNPKVYKRSQRCNHLVSHVDFLPTLAALFGAPKKARANWQGVDYSSSIVKPKKTKPPQDSSSSPTTTTSGAGEPDIHGPAQPRRRDPRATLEDRPLLGRRS